MTHEDFKAFEPQGDESLSPLFHTFTPIQQKQALKLVESLKLDRYEEILNFGAKVQEALASFSHQMLHHVQRKDVLKVGEILNQLMNRLQSIDPDLLLNEKQGFFQRLFGKTPATIQQTMTQFQRLGTQIDRLGIQLEYAQNSLLDDLIMLDELYKLNNTYYDELNIYIAAAQLRKQQALTRDLPLLKQQVALSNDSLSQQKVADLVAMIERLDQRLYDLELSKQLTLQTGPQIRLMQQTNQQLAEKIQMSILTTIPLWKNQISMLLTMNHQRRVAITQRKMAETTNEMMKKKTKLAKHTAKETQLEQLQTENEILSLKNTQIALLQMIEETIELQVKGNEKRKEIEHDMQINDMPQQQLMPQQNQTENI